MSHIRYYRPSPLTHLTAPLFEDETSELVRQIFLLELLTSDGKG
jgi:hypothetical protein